MAGPTTPVDEGQLPWLGRVIVRSAAGPQGSRWTGVAVAAVAALVTVTVDWLTGPDLSELVVYAALVAWISWAYPHPAGVLMATLGATAAGAVGLWHPDAAIATHIVIVNTVLRAGVLMSFSLGTALLRRTLTTLDRVSRLDPLTGLSNRRALYEQIERERARAVRRGAPITVGYFDLDGLKQVNDRDGHQAGDDLIVRFAATLRSELRRVDLLARLGGDEFAVVLPDTDVADATKAIRRIMALPGVPEASVGIVSWIGETPGVEEMVSAADALMYTAKQRKAGILARRMTALA